MEDIILNTKILKVDDQEFERERLQKYLSCILMEDNNITDEIEFTVFRITDKMCAV